MSKERTSRARHVNHVRRPPPFDQLSAQFERFSIPTISQLVFAERFYSNIKGLLLFRDPNILVFKINFATRVRDPPPSLRNQLTTKFTLFL